MSRIKRKLELWRTVVLGTGIFVLLAVSAISSDPASAACAPFPKIALWDTLTHDFARRHVNDKFGGDWQAYIETLQEYKTRLRAIQQRGTGAVVTWKNKKIRLEGRSITTFLKHFDRRIEVTQCLSGRDARMQDRVENIANFATAAGGGEKANAASQCDRIPEVQWWKFKTHDSISGYVDRRYQGDWDSYIGNWTKRLEKLQNIYSRGASAVASNGIVLRGSILAIYIGNMRERIAITRCLAGIRKPSKI
ncbi:MAG: hypothetical protein HQ494_10605 [Rhodospirillales bacterium]|nr:hypothetical protein [Rhodospirillales bacterium]